MENRDLIKISSLRSQYHGHSLYLFISCFNVHYNLSAFFLCVWGTILPPSVFGPLQFSGWKLGAWMARLCGPSEATCASPPIEGQVTLVWESPIFFHSLGHRDACSWGGALLVLPVSLRLPFSWPLPVSPLPQQKHIHRGVKLPLLHFSSGVSDCPPLLSARCFGLCLGTSHGPQKAVHGVISASARAVCPRARPSLTIKVPQCPVLLGASPPAQTLLSYRRLLTGANRDLTLLFRNL